MGSQMTKFAMVFPGQGSQSVGMLAELAADEALGAIVRDTFSEATNRLGRDLWALVAQGPAEALDQTCWTQPAVLTGDTALWRCWQHLGGPQPAILAGHSLGEYAALVASGALAFDDAVAVVHERGRLMQEACADGEGAMAAILGLDHDVVEGICERIGDGSAVVAANYNAPGQIVIAGYRDAVEQATAACSEAGARRAVKLPVSVAAHSPMMAAAMPGLEIVLEQIDIAAPGIPVLHNADLESHDRGEAIRRALVNQLTRPVPWTGTIARLVETGVTNFGECGPGRVLCGLGRRIERGVEWLALETPDALRAAVERMSGE